MMFLNVRDNFRRYLGSDHLFEKWEHFWDDLGKLKNHFKDKDPFLCFYGQQGHQIKLSTEKGI